MLDDRKDQIREQNDAPDLNHPVSKTEQIQVLVNFLASNYGQAGQQKPGQASNNILPKRDLAGHNLEQYESWLADAHLYYRDASQQKKPLTYASEWVLDNYYIIRQSLLQIKKDLPTAYYNQLPKLIDGSLKEYPRIYAIARAVLSYQHLLLDPVDLQTILIQLQERVPLTMGELWALPIFLRYSLIESLAHVLVSTIHPPKPPDLPHLIPLLADLNDPISPIDDSAGDTAASDGVANIVLSLRTISEQDWSDFFESVSRLERTLRKDPAGIYPRMDFKTRDLYRKEIEGLSLATGRDEIEVAELLLDLAGSNIPDPALSLPTTPAAGSRDDAVSTPSTNRHADMSGNSVMAESRMHIGEVLLGKGRIALEEQIGFQPDLLKALKRFGFKFATAAYLFAIFLLSGLILVYLASITPMRELLTSIALPAGSSPWMTALTSGNFTIRWIVIGILAIAIMTPALTAATSLVNWLITLVIRPRILPKLNFKGEIPESYQTLVVIPALITSRKEIDSLVHQLELHYLRNPEPGLLFALLTDFKDADTEFLPEDEDLVRYALTSVEALNRKYGPSSSNDSDASHDADLREGARLFYFLHRKRLWNPSEGKWIGWERKRGKLHELNLLLRGGTNLSFTTLSGDTGASKAALEHVRFVITLDTDTILPSGAASRLVGTLAHPLNRAVFDDKTGRVISGYTVLQPRMEIHPKSVNHSWFTRFFAGDAGLDLYTLSVSDAYQDLFGEGSYVGKGIYDVDAFERSVDNHIPENTVLSHDLLEGLMGRAGLVTDITMIEEYPQNYFIQIMRQRRWIRGDWQLLPWLFRPGRYGMSFSVIDRWKMFDNLRRALLAPSLLLIFILGMIFLPGLAGLWVMIVFLSLAIPVLTGLTRSLLQIAGGGVPGAALRPLAWNLMR